MFCIKNSAQNLEIHQNAQRVFFKIGVLKNFANFTGKHLLESLFNKKETPTLVFSCEICEILRTASFTKHLQWLRLSWHFYVCFSFCFTVLQLFFAFPIIQFSLNHSPFFFNFTIGFYFRGCSLLQFSFKLGLAKLQLNKIRWLSISKSMVCIVSGSVEFDDS